MKGPSFLQWLFGEWGCSRCERMHRRAQAAESATAKAIRQNDHERLWRTVDSLRWRAQAGFRRARHWRKQYDLIKAAQCMSVEPQVKP